MKKNFRVRRHMAAKTKAILSLAIALVLTVAVAIIAVAGMPLDARGLYKLKPWLPSTNVESWPTAIALGLDLRGGVYVEYQATQPEDVEADFGSLMDGTISIIQNRLSDKGYPESTVVRIGNDGIRVEIPDVTDPNAILDLIGSPAKLEFLDPDGNVFMEGKNVETATAGSNPETTGYVVYFTLTPEGSKIFADMTSKHIGEILTIQLDGVTLTEPKVETAITGGNGYISGMSTLEQAQNIALKIQSGALPLVIKQQKVDTISATLGIDALSTSVTAAIIGLLLVMLLMAVRYRLCGVIASWALCIYMLLLFFLIAIVPGIQLTLPGIAGIVLGIGMAVDANVIIFERFGEEIKKGRTVRGSVKTGFKNAMSAIVDSNVTTLIAATVLLFFGTGSIQGFAKTLFLSVITSMITAIIVTRFLLTRTSLLIGEKPALFTRVKFTAKEEQ